MLSRPRSARLTGAAVEDSLRRANEKVAQVEPKPEPAGWQTEANAPMDPLADQAVVCGSITAGTIAQGRELLDLVDQAPAALANSETRADE